MNKIIIIYFQKNNMNQKILQIIISIYLIIKINSVKYPKNKNITKLPKYKDIKSIEIQSTNEIKNYIQNSDYVITLFHQDWCGHCKRFLPIFDEASQYEFVNNFKFLKINCNKKEICNFFNVDRYPTIKVYIRGNELKFEPIRELIPLLEFLQKISTNPLIKVNNDIDFYNNYGNFSPLVEYNEKNTEFISCISMLAKNDFLIDFYFGIKSININDKNKEKVKFNFDGINIEYLWNRECDDIKEFLNNNVYPILNEIDGTFIKLIQKNPRITIMLFYHKNNLKQVNFIQNQFKKIAFENRKFVFGYVDLEKETDLAKYFGITKLDSQMQIIIYDFIESKYYIHKESFDINSSSSEKADNDIRNLVNNINRLSFTTGDFFEDLFLKFGFKVNSSVVKLILMIGVLVLIMLTFIIIIICDSGDENEKTFHPKTQ
jgi:thiol-disulfide isomerase/thioredoxin